MLASVQAFIPTEWRGAYEILSTPIAWVPDWHTLMINLVWYGSSTTEVLLKRVVILFPMLLLIAAVWTTMVSLYTIPFRSGRGRFITTLAMSWWDAGRAAWFYWAGIVRLGVVLVGWVWSSIRMLIRLVHNVIKGTVKSPLMLLDWTSRNYFKPGVPWLAFLALLFWSAIEAVIFMYTLQPTMSEVLAGITGFEPSRAVMGPILFIFLFFLVLGSFACVHALGEAIQKMRWREIIQMTLVEAFVMFFEVIFLYRELIDAVTPWIAQQSGGQVQLGLGATLALACFGWIGVRGMTWFLFGRYGTPALVSVLARETIKQKAEGMQMPEASVSGVWAAPISALKTEIEWFKKEARYVFELLSLPVLQLFAAAVNFIVITIGSKPIFSLPFNSISDVLISTPKLFSSREQKPARGSEPQPQFQHGGTP